MINNNDISTIHNYNVNFKENQLIDHKCTNKLSNYIYKLFCRRLSIVICLDFITDIEIYCKKKRITHFFYSPMNIYEMGNRMSFVAVFGTISYLCYEVILNSKYIFPFSGHLGIRCK